MNKILTVIPARGGSKGLPGKNIRPLYGKPLIGYSIDAAREVLEDKDICVSTDSPEIAKVVEEYGLQIPFLRPEYLATDTATTADVLLHAIEFFQRQGKNYDLLLLLQPTSPFRNGTHIREALALSRPGIEMIVSVKRSHAAQVICCENREGYLTLPLNPQASRRQECPDYYEYNGAIYVIDIASFLSRKSLNFERKVKYVMDEYASVDIDHQEDLLYAEFLMNQRVN